MRACVCVCVYAARDGRFASWPETPFTLAPYLASTAAQRRRCSSHWPFSAHDECSPPMIPCTHRGSPILLLSHLPPGVAALPAL